jgi:hypothetical protein
VPTAHPPPHVGVSVNPVPVGGQAIARRLAELVIAKV